MKDDNSPNLIQISSTIILASVVVFFLCVFPPISFTILIAWMFDSIRGK